MLRLEKSSSSSNSGMFVEWKSAEGNGNGFKVFSKMFNVFHISYAKLQQKHLMYL